jgi:penicillin-binding protein-related factor A (putative recombinase)
MTATTKQFIAKNGLDNNNNIITNVSNPISNTDAVNKQYVDTLIAQYFAGDTTDHNPLLNSAYIDYGNQDPNTANNVTLNIIDSHGNLFMTDMRKSNGISTLRRLAMIF